MFAHQVIDDTNALLSRNDRDSWIEAIRPVVNSIQQSQHFHLGTIEELPKSIQGKNLFMDDLAVNFRLPYKKCWFDAILPNVSKIGLYVYELSDELIQVYFYQHFKQLGFWAPFPLFVVYSIGKPIRMVNNYGNILANLGFPSDYMSTIKPSWTYARGYYKDNLTQEEVDYFDEMGCTLLTILNYYILLLNCKNVETKAIEPSSKLNTKRKKNGNQPVFTYKLLQVTVPIRRTASGSHKQEDISHRIHLCRGHFKYYTEEKPLFGSVTGLFWWQPHVRGRNREGVVMKDYEVKVA